MADGFAQASGRPDPRQPAHRPGRRQRGRRDLQRPGEQVAAGDHRRPAGPGPDHDRGQPDQPRRDRRCRSRTSSGATSRRVPRTSRARSRGRSTTRRCPRAGRRSSRSRWTTGPRRPTPTAPTGALARTVTGRSAPDPAALDRAGGRLAAAQRPVARGRSRHRRRPAAGTPPSHSPRSSGCRSGRARRPAARGSASPSATPTSPASCRPRSVRSSETLKDHDLVLVVGSSVFPYYPYLPGPLLAARHRAGGDHQRPRRGRPGTDGRRDRGRRRARAGAAARARARGPAPRAGPAPGPGRACRRRSR